MEEPVNLGESHPVIRRRKSAHLHPSFFIAAGANFHPKFLQLNPNGTLPTLATSKRVYTSTTEVLRYLIDNAPKPGGKPSRTNLVERLHSPDIDPNFSMLSAVCIGPVSCMMHP